MQITKVFFHEKSITVDRKDDNTLKLYFLKLEIWLPIYGGIQNYCNSVDAWLCSIYLNFFYHQMRIMYMCDLLIS